MKPRPAATLTSPAPCGAFLCLSASQLNGAAQAPPLPRAAALPAALPLSPFRPAPPRLGKPRRRAASLCLISQSPAAAGRLCRPLTVPPLASPAPCGQATATPFRRPVAGTAPPRKGGNPGKGGKS